MLKTVRYFVLCVTNFWLSIFGSSGHNIDFQYVFNMPYYINDALSIWSSDKKVISISNLFHHRTLQTFSYEFQSLAVGRKYYRYWTHLFSH